MNAIWWCLYTVGAIVSAGFLLGLLTIADVFKREKSLAVNIVAVLFVMAMAGLLSWVGVIALIIFGYSIQKEKDATGWDK